MSYTIKKVIPVSHYKGQSAGYWEYILNKMIDEMRRETDCDRDELVFSFNDVAFREIFYRFKGQKENKYFYYSITCKYDARSDTKRGEILGIKFEVNEYDFKPSEDAILYLKANEKTYLKPIYKYEHWLDECFKPIVDTDTIKKTLNAEFGLSKMSDFYDDRFKNKEKTMKIKRVIFNDPATIVFWEDGTKTVVKCMKGETFDPEKGILVAWYKKLYGNKPNYMKEIKKWADSYYDIVTCPRT